MTGYHAKFAFANNTSCVNITRYHYNARIGNSKSTRATTKDRDRVRPLGRANYYPEIIYRYEDGSLKSLDKVGHE